MTLTQKASVSSRTESSSFNLTFSILSVNNGGKSSVQRQNNTREIYTPGNCSLTWNKSHSFRALVLSCLQLMKLFFVLVNHVFSYSTTGTVCIFSHTHILLEYSPCLIIWPFSLSSRLSASRTSNILPLSVASSSYYL